MTTYAISRAVSHASRAAVSPDLSRLWCPLFVELPPPRGHHEPFSVDSRKGN